MPLFGLDIGSSFVKGAVLDPRDGSIRHVVRAPFPERAAGLPSGWFEIDPEQAFTATQAVLEQLLTVEPQPTRLVACGQMGGVILVDSRGAALTRYLSWRDQRSTTPSESGPAESSGPSFLDRLRSSIDARTMQELGNELRAGSALTLLTWLQATNGLPAGATPLSISDYVLGRLCGAEPQMQFTQALGLLDLPKRAWHHRLFEQLKLDRLTWAPLREIEQTIGEWRVGGRGVPVHPPLGDHQCALRGADLEADELSLNISTGSQVSRIITTPESGDFQTRPYVDRRYLKTITHLPAGRSLEVIVGLLTEIATARGTPLADPWGYLAEASERAADTTLEVDLAFFAGPLGDRGSIRNITTENLTAGGLLAAALRNMASNYQHCAGVLNPAADYARIVLSGGIAQRFPLLRRLLAERFPVPQRLCDVAEDTLHGLLRTASTLG